MSSDGAAPFSRPIYRLKPDRGGVAVELVPLSAGDARTLGTGFAGMSPWRDYRLAAATLEAFLARAEPQAPRWAIRAGGRLAGAAVIHRPWLHGPYLQFLGLADGYRDQGIGACVLEWIEQEALGRYRNLWLCVSATNARAEAFYQRHGYRRTAVLDGLVAHGIDEILMRKRLS